MASYRYQKKHGLRVTINSRAPHFLDRLPLPTEGAYDPLVDRKPGSCCPARATAKEAKARQRLLDHISLRRNVSAAAEAERSSCERPEASASDREPVLRPRRSAPGSPFP